MTSIQTIIDKLKNDDYTIEEVLDLSVSPAALVRVNSVFALCRYVQKLDNSDTTVLVDYMYEMAQRDENKIGLLGLQTINHLLIGCLKEIGTESAIEKANLLIDQTSGLDREVLLRYLESLEV